MGVDYYSVLGVSKYADKIAIKRAYRNMALKYHPDRNHGSQEASERFKVVLQAFEVLQDEKRRALYDEFGEEGLTAGFGPEETASSGSSDRTPTASVRASNNGTRRRQTSTGGTTRRASPQRSHDTATAPSGASTPSPSFRATSTTNSSGVHRHHSASSARSTGAAHHTRTRSVPSASRHDTLRSYTHLDLTDPNQLYFIGRGQGVGGERVLYFSSYPIDDATDLEMLHRVMCSAEDFQSSPITTRPPSSSSRGLDVFREISIGDRLGRIRETFSFARRSGSRAKRLFRKMSSRRESEREPEVQCQQQ